MAEHGFPDLSPLFQAADLIGFFYDPILRALNTIYGDPGSLEAEASRLRTVQSNVNDAHDLIGRHVAVLARHWSGDAFAAFQAYVADVIKRLDHLSSVIEQVAAELDEAASAIRAMWASITSAALETIGAVVAALAAARATSGLSLLAAFGLLFVCLDKLTNVAHEWLSSFDAPRRKIMEAREEFANWAAGGAGSLFGEPALSSSAWVAQ